MDARQHKEIATLMLANKNLTPKVSLAMRLHEIASLDADLIEEDQS